MTLQIVRQIGPIVESRDLDLAAKIYSKVGESYSKHSSAELAKMANEMVASFNKRKAIIGQPFEVEGVTLEGQPFDWGKYQGKVVLVDFWATWCGPCLEEIPNIKQNYDQYREQGFEVVGVNLDEEPESVQRFFSRQRLPWVTVVSSDPKKVGFENPLAVKCGLESIPFLVLVGRDGKAMALNPRGPELGKKLAAIFNSPSAENPLRSDADKKAAPTKDKEKDGGT
jgi:thiol-disulfide isomerase/thioredoxin